MNRRTELWDESAASRVISLFSAVEGRNIYTSWKLELPPFLVFGRYGAMFSLKVSAREFQHLTALISAINSNGLPDGVSHTHGLPKEPTWNA